MLQAAWNRIATALRVDELRELLAYPSAYPGATVTPRRLLNMYLSRYEWKRGLTRLRSYPTKLTVESTNICNLRCPACFTGVGETGRQASHMSLDLFRGLMRELGPYLLEVEFHNWGEPLLAKNIYEMMEEAHGYGIHTTISTNFSIPFDAARAERLVKSGLTVLGVSIDGAQQDTYVQYRRRGKLDLVLENCRLVRDAKRRLGSATPRMVWEFHIFAHNKDDIAAAKALAEELEMDIAIDKGWVIGPDWDTEKQYRFFVEPRPVRCHFPWGQAVVNNEGGVAPCCGTFYREDDVGLMSTRVGDGGASTFREVWNNARFQQVRQLFRSRRETPDTKDLVCLNCPVTLNWERYKDHRAAGGARDTFKANFDVIECFNYFWRRRPERLGRAPAVAPTPEDQQAHVAS